jgi:hypothetical protein
MNKHFVSKMSGKIVEKFPDNVQINSLFEVAQTMMDQGKEPKEIKKILKELYNASPDELERLEDKFFKNKINASEEGDESIAMHEDLSNSLKEVLAKMDSWRELVGPEYFITVAKLSRTYELLQEALEEIESSAKTQPEEFPFETSKEE